MDIRRNDSGLTPRYAYNTPILPKEAFDQIVQLFNSKRQPQPVRNTTNLPKELIDKVFRLLKPESQRLAVQVCYSWRTHGTNTIRREQREMVNTLHAVLKTETMMELSQPWVTFEGNYQTKALVKMQTIFNSNWNEKTALQCIQDGYTYKSNAFRIIFRASKESIEETESVVKEDTLSSKTASYFRLIFKVVKQAKTAENVSHSLESEINELMERGDINEAIALGSLTMNGAENRLLPYQRAQALRKLKGMAKPREDNCSLDLSDYRFSNLALIIPLIPDHVESVDLRYNRLRDFSIKDLELILETNIKNINLRYDFYASTLGQDGVESGDVHFENFFNHKMFKGLMNEFNKNHEYFKASLVVSRNRTHFYKGHYEISFFRGDHQQEEELSFKDALNNDELTQIIPNYCEENLDDLANHSLSSQNCKELLGEENYSGFVESAILSEKFSEFIEGYILNGERFKETFRMNFFVAEWGLFKITLDFGNGDVLTIKCGNECDYNGNVPPFDK